MITRQEIYSLLQYHFVGNLDGRRAKEIGDIWFLYKDTYGVPIGSLMQATAEAAKAFADSNIEAVYSYMKNKRPNEVE